MLDVTEAAVNEFKKFIREANADGAGIRVFAAPGGCCGPTFGLDISQNGNEGDDVVEKYDLKIYIDPAISDILSNATIDYIEDGPRKGFTILGLPKSGCC